MPNLMYHFVGCDDNLRGISLDAFTAQVSFLQERYSKDEFALTFDHGTIDHIERAAPELEKRGLRGFFFILTMVPEERRVSAIDKQRFLEARLRNELAWMLCADLNINYRPEEANGYLEAFNFYSQEERYLRFLRDTRVPRETYEELIGKYFQQVFGDEQDFAAERYLSWDHIAQLHDRGHIIGSHSHRHYGDKEDFERSVRLIEERINFRPQYVSYPNGEKRISDADLRKIGIRRAFISTPHGVGPYTVGRIDCKQWTQ